MATRAFRVRSSLDVGPIAGNRRHRHQWPIARNETPFPQHGRRICLVLCMAGSQGFGRGTIFDKEPSYRSRSQQAALQTTSQDAHIHPQIDFHARMKEKTVIRTAYHHIHSQGACIIQELASQKYPQDIGYTKQCLHGQQTSQGGFGLPVRQQGIAQICSPPVRTKQRITQEGDSSLPIRLELHGKVCHLVIYR